MVFVLNSYIKYVIFLSLLVISPVFAQSIGISPPAREINLTVGETGTVTFTVMQSSDNLWENGAVEEEISWAVPDATEFQVKSCVLSPTDCHFKLNFTVGAFDEPGTYSGHGSISVGLDEGGAMSTFASVRFDITANVKECFSSGDCPEKTCDGNLKKEWNCENNSCVLHEEMCETCEKGICIPESCLSDADCGESYCENGNFRFFHCNSGSCSTFIDECDYGCSSYGGCYGDCNSNSDCMEMECLDSSVLRLYKCEGNYCTINDIHCSFGCENNDCANSNQNSNDYIPVINSTQIIQFNGTEAEIDEYFEENPDIAEIWVDSNNDTIINETEIISRISQNETENTQNEIETSQNGGLVIEEVLLSNSALISGLVILFETQGAWLVPLLIACISAGACYIIHKKYDFEYILLKLKRKFKK